MQSLICDRTEVSPKFIEITRCGSRASHCGAVGSIAVVCDRLACARFDTVHDLVDRNNVAASGQRLALSVEKFHRDGRTGSCSGWKGNLGDRNFAKFWIGRHGNISKLEFRARATRDLQSLICDRTEVSPKFIEITRCGSRASHCGAVGSIAVVCDRLACARFDTVHDLVDRNNVAASGQRLALSVEKFHRDGRTGSCSGWKGNLGDRNFAKFWIGRHGNRPSGRRGTRDGDLRGGIGFRL